MKREQSRTIYRAGEEPAVNKLCELSAKLEAQTKEIATLKKNSLNSSKPPSSDIVKPNKKKKNSTTNNSRGGQPGHSKHERRPFNDHEIDESRDYHCPACPDCDSGKIIWLDVPPKIIQQTELLEVVTKTEEYRAYAYYCGDCDKTHCTPFPESLVKEGLFKA